MHRKLFTLLILAAGTIFCAQPPISWNDLPADVKVFIGQTVARTIIPVSQNRENNLPPTELFNTIKTIMQSALISKKDALLISKYRHVILEQCTKSKNTILMASFGLKPEDILKTHLKEDYPEKFWGDNSVNPDNCKKLITNPIQFTPTLLTLKKICTQIPTQFRLTACNNFLNAVSDLMIKDTVPNYQLFCVSKIPLINKQVYVTTINELIENRQYALLSIITSKKWPLLESHWPGDYNISALKRQRTQEDPNSQKIIDAILNQAYVLDYRDVNRYWVFSYFVGTPHYINHNGQIWIHSILRRPKNQGWCPCTIL